MFDEFMFYRCLSLPENILLCFSGRPGETARLAVLDEEILTH